MRVFLIWAGKYKESEGIISELIRRNHKILYWVGLKDGDELSDCLREQGTIFHDHFAAWDGTPAKNVDPGEFDPPGKDLIEKFYKVESLILTMMNKHFDKMCVDERRHLYYNMLGYWHGVIKKYKPEAIIFPIVPHTVYNYIIYELAKLLDIKTVMFEDSWVSDRMLMYNDWEEGSRQLKKRMEINQGKNFSIDDLSQDLQEYYNLQMGGDSNDAKPLYLKAWEKQFIGAGAVIKRLKILLYSLKDGTFFKKIINYLSKHLRQNLKKEYCAVQVEPDFSKKFVYMPLNFQPERTSSPQGDMFVDQILIIETLSASLSKDWVIYVKEHPTQWWLRDGLIYSSVRYRGYYERIARLKNVYIVPITVDTYTLTNKSQVVATVTGTAGWEATLRLKPVIIFGYPFYRDFPFLFRVKDVETCKAAFKKITKGFKFSKQDVLNYLKSFDESTTHGFIEIGIEENSKFSKEESLQNMAEAILSDIEQN